MFLFLKRILPYIIKFFINVLKCGPIPKHVAVIMDGNRRFAEKMKTTKIAGHTKGYDRLIKVVNWCAELGIEEVTFYVFSIENFKRTPKEVEDLWNLIGDTLESLLDETEHRMPQRLYVRSIGNRSLLPPRIQRISAQLEEKTKTNAKMTLTLAAAYTSREEISNAAKILVRGVKDGLINVEDIDEDLFSECLYTSGNKDPGILIRTSGEVRFSDYLLWQISNTFIYFSDMLWPEFGVWEFLVCLLRYQKAYHHLQAGKTMKKEKKEHVKKFLKILQDEKDKVLKAQSYSE